MANPNVMQFNAANWEQEVLRSAQPVVVDFWAPWCAPCRLLTPIIDRLADQFAGRVKVGKVNFDDEQDLTARYKVNSIPRVFIFQGGEFKQQVVGLKSEAELTELINKALT